MSIKIETIEELKSLADIEETDEAGLSCFVSYNAGLTRSSKWVTYWSDDDTWEIHHESTDLIQRWSSTESFIESEFITELESGVVYSYE